MCYFTVTVLGRVDEKCAQREQQNTSECDVATNKIEPDRLSVDEDATDILAQKLEHIDVSTELSCQCTDNKLQGKCCFIGG